MAPVAADEQYRPAQHGAPNGTEGSAEWGSNAVCLSNRDGQSRGDGEDRRATG